MVFTSKTLIPGKQPIGQNRDGSYIYDGEPMSVMPKKTVAPITTQSTGIPNVGIPGVKGLTTPIAPSMSSKLPPVTFSADRAKEINARPAPTPQPSTNAPTGTIIPIEEKKRRVILMEQQGGTQEDIQAYLDYLKSQETAAPTPQGTFADQRPDEGVIEQTAKAIPRGIAEYGKGIWGNIKNTAGGVADVATSTFDAGKRLVTGDYYTPEESEAELAKQRTGFLKAIAGGTGLLTDIIPATAATKVGFNIAAETPGLRVVPQAVGGAMELGVKGLEAVGVSPENAQNVISTAGNIALLRGGAKGQAKIMDTYKAKGLTPAVLETAKGVPRTVYETAKQPVDLAVGTVKMGAKAVDWGIGKIAQSLLTNKTGTQELFQATSPSINKLGKNIGIDKLKEKSALADDTVVRAGYKPTNTTERVEAYKGAMQDIWKDIEKARGGAKESFKGREIGDLIRAKINESKVNGKMSPSQKADVVELQKWAEYYDSLGTLDMPKLADIRTQINGETTWNKKIANGDLFNKTFQDLAAVIRKTENNVIDSAKGGSFQGLMDRYGAIVTLLEDVVKQDVKAQRARGDGLATTYSRIEGVGDILQGSIKTITGQRGLGEVAKGLGKIVVGKTLSKLKETDFLIENGYNKLAKTLGVEKGPTKVPTKRIFPETKGLTPIQESLGKSKLPSKGTAESKLPKTPVEKKASSKIPVSKEENISSSKVNTPIISQITKKQTVPAKPVKKVDTELQSLQESIPTVKSSVEVPEGYMPKDGLPTGTEFENSVISQISKTRKIPNPEIKRPQVRGFDLGVRSNIIDSLKEQGMFTDSFFLISDKKVASKFIDYAEQKAIKKGATTTGSEPNLASFMDNGKRSADIKLTPKEYLKGEKGTYLNLAIDGEKAVHINASYADIFYKNFDDVSFKGSNELSPVLVMSKGEPVGLIIPVKQVERYTKVGDFGMPARKSPTKVEMGGKRALPMSQKSDVVYSKPIQSLESEARKYKSAEDYINALFATGKKEQLKNVEAKRKIIDNYKLYNKDTSGNDIYFVNSKGEGGYVNVYDDLSYIDTQKMKDLLKNERLLDKEYGYTREQELRNVWEKEHTGKTLVEKRIDKIVQGIMELGGNKNKLQKYIENGDINKLQLILDRKINESTATKYSSFNEQMANSKTYLQEGIKKDFTENILQGKGKSIFQNIKSQESIGRKLEDMGYSIKYSGSNLSKSKYLEIKNPENGETFKIRISDHTLPFKYKQKVGLADFQIGNFEDADMQNAFGLEYVLGEKIGKTPELAKILNKK